MKKLIYCVYKGEEFIDVGTLEELSKRLKIKSESLRWMSTPSALKRNKGDRLQVYKLNESEKL